MTCKLPILPFNFSLIILLAGPAREVPLSSNAGRSELYEGALLAGPPRTWFLYISLP